MHHGCCVQEEQQRMQELLGHVNNALVTRVLQAMAEGNAQAIGWVWQNNIIGISMSLLVWAVHATPLQMTEGQNLARKKERRVRFQKGPIC